MIDQDAVMYVSSLSPGQKTGLDSAPRRHAYLFVISGELDLNGQRYSAGDQARIANETRLEITAVTETELMLLDLP
jgi:hypothetical protein